MNEISKHRWLRWLRRLAVFGTALGLIGRAVAAAPMEIRIGYQKSSVNLAILKSQAQLETRFKGSHVVWSEFPAGPQLLEALNIGSLDFGMTGDTPPVFAQAAGSSLVYVGVEPPKPESSAILLPKDSPLRTLHDLKGKRIAFQKGSSAHYVVLRALEKAGLKYSDIQPVYLAPADARAAFEHGSIDAWSIWDPYWAAAEQGGPLRVLSTGKDLTDNNTFYLAARAFALNHADVVSTLLNALTQADDYARDHPSETVTLVATSTGISTDAARRFLDRRPRSPVVPLNPTVVASQQQLADTFFQAGLIPKPLKVADAVWQPAALAAAP